MFRCFRKKKLARSHKVDLNVLKQIQERPRHHPKPFLDPQIIGDLSWTNSKSYENIYNRIQELEAKSQDFIEYMEQSQEEKNNMLLHLEELIQNCNNILETMIDKEEEIRNLKMAIQKETFTGNAFEFGITQLVSNSDTPSNSCSNFSQLREYVAQKYKDTVTEQEMNLDVLDTAINCTFNNHNTIFINMNNYAYFKKIKKIDKKITQLLTEIYEKIENKKQYDKNYDDIFYRKNVRFFTELYPMNIRVDREWHLTKLEYEYIHNTKRFKTAKEATRRLLPKVKPSQDENNLMPLLLNPEPEDMDLNSLKENYSQLFLQYKKHLNDIRMKDYIIKASKKEYALHASRLESECTQNHELLAKIYNYSKTAQLARNKRLAEYFTQKEIIKAMHICMENKDLIIQCCVALHQALLNKAEGTLAISRYLTENFETIYQREKEQTAISLLILRTRIFRERLESGMKFISEKVMDDERGETIDAEEIAEYIKSLRLPQ